MRRSKAEIYLHFVWATHQRQPLVTPEVEAALYGCLVGEAQRLGCDVLAIGGMPDHVHVAVQMPTRVSAAQLMQRMKGVSSAYARRELLPDQPFGWQDNYAVFSLSRPHRRRVVAYIRGQKQHHAAGTLWPEWEETDEDAPLRASAPPAAAESGGMEA